jgi:pyrroline-5-carboxylate reductase
MSYELGFIGAGNMAEAIAQAGLRAKVLPAEAMIAADPSAARRQLFADLGIKVVENNHEVVSQSKQVLLAVKPQSLPLLTDLLGRINPRTQVVISIMAGITTGRIAAMVGDAARVVRVMPNTPMMVGLGMAGVALGSDAKPQDAELAMKLFGAAGQAVLVQESDIDAITAVSGSGPAYVYYLAQAMEQAAAALGLSAQAKVLARQTIMGAAAMLQESPDSAAELRRKVTSPGGTTAAAIAHLDDHHTTDIIVNAIKAAHQRSLELGQ